MTETDPKINVRNIVISLFLIAACAYTGAISTMPHQAEIVTAAINIPSQFSESHMQVSEESVTYAIQSDQGVLLVLTVDTIIKVTIMAGVVIVVFFLMGMAGIGTRFGAMGD